MRHFKFFSNKNYKNILKNNYFFKDFSMDFFEEILYKYDWYTETFEKGQCSFETNRFTKDFNILLSGELKIEKTVESGEVILYDFIRENGVFGIAFLNLNLSLDNLHLEANQKSTLFIIKEEEYKKILNDYKIFLNKHNEFQDYRLAFFIRRFENSFLSNPRDKILYFFDYCKTFNTFEVSIPKTQLANYINIGRASLYRELRKLEVEGRIRVEGNIIKLL